MFDLPQQPLQQPKAAIVFNAGTRMPIAGIVNIPPKGKGNENLTYQQLVCTERDQARIYEIITTMADDGVISLGIKKNYLEQLGAEINHVHPLKFLATIFSNPRLKKSMRDVYDSYFKWTGFLGGLTPRLADEAKKGKLNQYAEDFANEVNVPSDKVLQFFEARDWENLVRFLIRQ